MYYSLIYTSKAVKIMQDEELLFLLEQSRSWNKEHGITGLLLYMQARFLKNNEGRFMQVLEGTEFEIKRLFENIKKDRRHNSIVVLNEVSIKKRNFETWTMGFESPELDHIENVDGFFTLNDGFLNSNKKQKFNSPLNFLKSFYLMSGSKS